MLDERSVADTLISSLKHGKQYASPFPLTLYHPFSETLYEQILAHLPDDRFYEPLMHSDAVRPDGTSTRLVLSLTADSLRHLPAEQREFWSDFNAVMHSHAIRD